jgi:glycosyltransferase involved in cell wall biosynthesis
MNKKLDFSVIVCCYNSSITKLEKTIFSIENQKGVTFEIIVSDDGSCDFKKDELIDWINNKHYTNIKLNLLPKNVGTVKNIISAIKISKGLFVKTISPGDFLFDSSSLSIYLSYFYKKNADILFSKARYFDTNGKILYSRSPGSPFSFKKLFMKKNVCLFKETIPGVAVAAKKNTELHYLSLIEGKIKYVEDRALMVLGLLDGLNVIGISQYLVWYEFGTGISNGEHSEIITKDRDALFALLGEINCNAKCKKISYLYFKTKNKNKFYSNLIYGLNYPSYFFFKASCVLKPRFTIATFREKKKFDSIEEMK